jgi:mannose-6-phosphate isomerase-like protein (cupin superfamily)
MKTTMWIAGTTLAIAFAARADDRMKGRAEQPSGKPEAVYLNAKDLKWAPGIPDLPKGLQMTVMFGDPSKAALYAARLKMPDGYKIPPHWHTQDEQLTIVEGTLVLHMGDSMKSEGHSLDVGGFHFLPGKMHHAAEAKGETIVQVQGMGPFDIHYLNAADNPNPKSAAAASKK